MITRKAEYAIRALWEMALNSDSRMTAGRIAQKQSIPPKYLPQIISQLTRARLVVSTRGFGGGLRLARASKNITLLDIIESVQGKLQLFECPAGKADCFHLPDCGLRIVFSQTQAALESVLRSTKLSDLKLSLPTRGDNA